MWLAALVVLTLGTPAALPSSGGAEGDPRRDFEKRRREFLLEAGERHLDLGLWCRDRGLVPQASGELLLAVEISEGVHPGANVVLSYMRRFDDAFWKKRKRPSAGNIKAYDGKAKKLLEEDREERFELAEFAWRKKLEPEALAEFEIVLRSRDEPLFLDDDGRIELPEGRLPPEASAHFAELAISINGGLYLRNEFLEHLAGVHALHEVSSEDLRLWAPAEIVSHPAHGPAALRDLHAMASSLLPHLALELQGRPQRRMTVFVFLTRANFDAWLDSAGQAGHKAVGGWADGGSSTAIVCAEGEDDEGLRALLLHEFTHLYSYGVTRAVMPSWYSEGLAEQYGGRGTFAWDGARLIVGDKLAPWRLESLRAAGLMDLRDFLGADAVQLFRTDRELALRFYAQAWALVRYLRTDADRRLVASFEEWEAMCRGAALGVTAGSRRAGDSSAATLLFRTHFAEHLEQLERDFQTYVDGL